MLKKADRLKIEKLMKAEIASLQEQLNSIEIQPSSNSGDSADMSASLYDEHAAILMKERLSKKIHEYKQALARINDLDFGICEETGEPIEVKRLLMVPTTRLSIEAQQRLESEKRNFYR